MKRVLPFLLVAAMLLVPAVAADWPQAGYGADRTSHPPGPGPATNATAFVAQLPGVPSGGFLGPPEPVIVDGQAYVPVRPSGLDDGPDGRGIARVDLSTGASDLFVEMNTTPQTIAAGDGRLYATRDLGMDAFDLETGEEIWSQDHPPQSVEHEQTFCQSPAVDRGRVYVVCTEMDEVNSTDTEPVGPAPDPSDRPPRPVPFAWMVNASTGEHLFLRQLVPATYSNEASSTVDDPETGASETRASPLRFAVGMSVVGSHAYALTAEFIDGGECAPENAACYNADSFHVRLWALDAGTLGVEWTNRSQTERAAWTYTPGTGFIHPVDDPQRPVATHVTGTSRVAYTKLDGAIQARSPADGSVLWSEPLGEADLEGNVGGMSSGLAGQALYTASAQTLYRFDTDVEVNTWRFALDPELDEEFGWGTVIAAEDRVYVMAQEFASPAYSALYVVDGDTGDLVFRERLDLSSQAYANPSFGPFASYGLADGVVVAAGWDGTLHVIGETEASLEPRVEVTTDYPAPGENVTVALSGTEPGAFGNATRYMAIWGDGNRSGWVEDPQLSHSYMQAGNTTARFFVGNEANQTATTTHVFHVGQPAPTEPNLVETAFARENQDLTFGILGILVALTGGVIGVGRRYRKRSRLQEELEALEAGFEETKGNPGECEAFLDNRKARARSLLLDGVLTEEQFGVIEGRVAELHRELRTTVLDTRFQFLPHGMVGSIKKMLADGRLTAWERDALEDLLDREEALSQAQKDQVRAQLDRWFGDDVGRGGPG